MRRIGTKARLTLALATSTLLIAGCLTGADSDPAPAAPPTGGGGGGGGGGENGAPSISGTPPGSITIGQNYSFVPTASDPDGDDLTFTVANLPGWATFDPSTGGITGVPTLGDTGMYSGISVTVTDGSLSDNLSPFAVDVIQVAMGSVLLTWTPPTENEDGSTPVNLAAYKFYYGTSPGTYPNSVRVNSPGISSYVVENLSPNTYYFVATAINTSGAESQFSNEAVKQVVAQ